MNKDLCKEMKKRNDFKPCMCQFCSFAPRYKEYLERKDAAAKKLNDSIQTNLRGRR